MLIVLRLGTGGLQSTFAVIGADGTLKGIGQGNNALANAVNIGDCASTPCLSVQFILNLVEATLTYSPTLKGWDIAHKIRQFGFSNRYFSL